MTFVVTMTIAIRKIVFTAAGFMHVLKLYITIYILHYDICGHYDNCSKEDTFLLLQVSCMSSSYTYPFIYYTMTFVVTMTTALRKILLYCCRFYACPQAIHTYCVYIKTMTLV